MVTNIQNLGYSYLLEEFGEEKITKRYITIYSYLEDYINRHNLSEKVIISEGLLNQMILDYFVDIYRLKDFHDIEKINSTKIHAYSSYWLLKRKPLQVTSHDEDSQDLIFVNERFVCGYLMRFLTELDYDVAILDEKKQDYAEFIDNLMYFFQYRINTPQMIEIMLNSFKAGRALQFSVDYQNQ